MKFWTYFAVGYKRLFSNATIKQNFSLTLKGSIMSP